MHTMLLRFFQDKRGKVVVWQMPNLPIISWALFLVIAHIVPGGGWHQAAMWLSFASLMVWAVLEVLWGASPFRRVLGLVVLVWSVATRLL